MKLNKQAITGIEAHPLKTEALLLNFSKNLMENNPIMQWDCSGIKTKLAEVQLLARKLNPGNTNSTTTEHNQLIISLRTSIVVHVSTDSQEEQPF